MPPLTRRLTNKIPAWLRGYAVSLACMGIASGVALAVPYRGEWRTFLAALFLAGLLASAWWGGFGGGIAAAMYTFFLAPRLVVPAHPSTQVNWISLTAIVAIAVLLSWAARSRRQLRAANAELDERVRERTAELERANRALQEREALLIQQTDELARSNADLEQFAYIASHDLQEPLRMVAIYTELLSRRYRESLDSQADGFIVTILEGVRRMETLIRDLLAYSHTIHGKAAAPRRFEAGEAAQVAMERLDLLIRESGARVQVGPLPEVHGDPVALTQVFQNLLSNALKYKSGARAQIHISAKKDRDGCVFSVRDNGIGIHPDYHETIFEPFKRLHAGETPGSGVGLAICRRIVERQGGRIWVESAPGEGADFRFTFPPANGFRSAGQLRS